MIRCSAKGATRKIRAQFLAGCDGAGSVVRRAMGIGLDDIDLRRLAMRELGLGRIVPAAIRAYLDDRETPMDGRVYLIHFTSPDRELFERFGTAWHTQSPEGWTLISQNDRDTWTLHSLLGAGTNADAIEPKQFLFAKLGIEFDCDIICANAWHPRLSLADSYGSGRVWLAGDSAHQVVPAGGYGMNTGVGDAVGLGWVRAAIVQGWGDHRLLEAYEAERRPVAARNRIASARHILVRLAIKTAYRKVVHGEAWDGERSRRRLGREILDLGNLENEADGIEFGYRYDSSPVICHEPHTVPADHMHAYTPGTQPGGRPPSLFLDHGQAMFDLFGLGFTLLRFAALDVDSLAAAAAERGMPLKIVDIRDDHARTLYERDLMLIRPDHHVAWRGDSVPDQPGAILDRIRGAAPAWPIPAAGGRPPRPASRFAHRLLRRNSSTARHHLVDSTN